MEPWTWFSSPLAIRKPHNILNIKLCIDKEHTHTGLHTLRGDRYVTRHVCVSFHEMNDAPRTHIQKQALAVSQACLSLLPRKELTLPTRDSAHWSSCAVTFKKEESCGTPLPVLLQCPPAPPSVLRHCGAWG